MSGTSSVAGPHPDLRELIFEALTNQAARAAPKHVFAAPASADDIVVRCQRTWHGIATYNERLNGASFSACTAEFERDGARFAYFVEAALPAGATTWGLAGWSGGPSHPRALERAGGFMLAGGSHVCVGGRGAAPEGGRVQVELADGTTYEDVVVDGCAIVFAPVTSPPSPDDHVTVRYLDAAGAELGSERVWMGDGKPPPGVRPAQA